MMVAMLTGDQKKFSDQFVVLISMAAAGLCGVWIVAGAPYWMWGQPFIYIMLVAIWIPSATLAALAWRKSKRRSA